MQRVHGFLEFDLHGRVSLDDVECVLLITQASDLFRRIDDFGGGIFGVIAAEPSGDGGREFGQSEGGG